MYSILFIRVVNEELNAKDPTDLDWKIRILNAIRKVWQSVLFRRFFTLSRAARRNFSFSTIEVSRCT